MCWAAACLADALHFAHERGVVHLDLKPSNILLANDGQPLLLDFHLAREPVPAGGACSDRLGGTYAGSTSLGGTSLGGMPAYMPAEQHAAMRAAEAGAPVPDAVDRRADVYSLGAILHEALGGSPPRVASSPPLTALNPQVSPGLAGIIARYTADRPADRYPDAGALADDLKRHLTDRPLAGAPNRSLPERWRKWRRRHPRPGGFRAAALVAVLVLAGGLSGVWQRPPEQSGAAGA